MKIKKYNKFAIMVELWLLDDDLVSTEELKAAYETHKKLTPYFGATHIGEALEHAMHYRQFGAMDSKRKFYKACSWNYADKPRKSHQQHAKVIQQRKMKLTWHYTNTTDFERNYFKTLN